MIIRLFSWAGLLRCRKEKSSGDEMTSSICSCLLQSWISSLFAGKYSAIDELLAVNPSLL
jgi:hypothetical protein